MKVRLTREESREQTRERLMEAARACVVQYGFEAASIGDIAEAAGYTKGAFFSNFESKDALLLELLRRHKAEQVERLRRVWAVPCAPGAPSPELERYFEQMAAECDWALLDVQLELQASRNAAFAERYEAVEQEYRTAMASLISQTYATAGRTLTTDAAQVARIMIALTRGLVLSHVADPARAPFAEHVKLVFWSLLAISEKAPGEG